jgi:hypothetical protein
MQPRNSLLIGQIALDLKLITREKLQQCLDLQAGQAKPRPIGALLVQEGFLTEEALARAIEEQRRRLEDSVPFATARKADASFGRLLVLGGHATQEHVNEALRAQQDLADRGVRKRLGELLVDSGRLPFEKVFVILKQQGKVLMSCTFCGTHLNVIQAIAEGYPCRRCGMPLEEKAVSVSAEDTAYLLPPADPRVARRTAPAPPPAAPTVSSTPEFRTIPAAWKVLVMVLAVLGLVLLAVFLLSRSE